MAFILGLMLLACPQETKDDPALAESVGQRVLELAHEDFHVRERASQKLFELGPSVVPLLKKSLNASSDFEVKSRIEEILARLEVNPLEAVKAFCRDRLEGKYSPTFNYDREGCGEIRSDLLERWFPDLIFFQAWGRNMEPSRRIVLGFHRKAKDVRLVASWEDLKEHVRPARKEEESREVAAAVARLAGTCDMCGTREIPSDLFKAAKNEAGYRIEGRYEHKATEKIVHAVYSWVLELDPAGRILSFETQSSFETKHE